MPKRRRKQPERPSPTGGPLVIAVIVLATLAVGIYYCLRGLVH